MKILFVEPYELTLFCFRKELLDFLISQKHEIVLCTNVTERITKEYSQKTKIINVALDLKDENIFSNLKLKNAYRKIIKCEQPDLILSFTIKPNLYCAAYAKNIPMIANITGLGNLFSKNNLTSKIGVHLYKRTFKNVNYVFFQNNDGLQFFLNKKIHINNYKIIPGSGVNLDKFKCNKKLVDDDNIHFLYCSRPIMEKGFHSLFQAIPNVVNSVKNVHFDFLINESEIKNNKKILQIYSEYKDYISFLGTTNDMISAYSNTHFTILPSIYREGISNVLLESLACERPIITTIDNPGCMEVIRDNENGYGVKTSDLDSLINALIKAAKTSLIDIEKMGKAGRELVMKNFDRKFVINTYLQTINELNKGILSNE